MTTNNEVVIGGNFSTYNGTTRNGIALVNTNGSLDFSFYPGNGFNGTVYAVAMQTNGQILVGGDFTTYNGTPANYIARLNLNGTLDTTFNPGTNMTNSVNAIALQPNGQIVVGGDFTSVNGVAGQDHITRLNANGSLDAAFNPGAGANGSIYALGLQPDGNIVIGGNFTMVNGQNNGIARLSGPTARWTPVFMAAAAWTVRFTTSPFKPTRFIRRRIPASWCRPTSPSMSAGLHRI